MSESQPGPTEEDEEGEKNMKTEQHEGILNDAEA